MVSIIEIPAKLNKNTGKKLNVKTKKRVCGYIRVSTNLDEQKSSYKAQYEYYLKLINENQDWKFIKIYADKGLTGTKIEHRLGFNEMINDALDGRFDMIITKSISRFARNTVDSLNTIRMLKKIGIDVFFERENFHTLGENSEFLLSIISCISQEESHSISENTKWGIHNKFENGIARRPYSKIFGYSKDEKGNLNVNDNEANAIKIMYDKYADGFSTSAIANYLRECGYKNLKGETKWSSSTIIKILRNEVYKGDSILQKYYSKDFISKEILMNTGELTRYEVKNDHVGIIERDLFDYVQNEIKNRESNRQVSRKSILSSKLYCGECKAPLGRKIWRIKGEKSFVYLCNDRLVKNCNIHYVKESVAKNVIANAINFLYKNKDKNIIYAKKSIDNIEKKLIKNAKCKKYMDEIEVLRSKMFRYKIFAESLEKIDNVTIEYNEQICAKLIDKMYVYNDRYIVFFNNGQKITLFDKKLLVY